MVAVGDVCGDAQAFCRFALNHSRLPDVALREGAFVFLSIDTSSLKRKSCPQTGWGMYAPIAPQLTE